MKKLMPLVIALLGLGAGVGAGMALKPAPEPEEVADACPEPAALAEGQPSAEAPAEAPGEAAAEELAAAGDGANAADPCAGTGSDPFAAASGKYGPEIEGEITYVPMDKPFVVPVFKEDKVTAMVVVSLAVETGAEDASKIEALKPRLRDSFLKVMFRHANSGGFDGSFTGGRKMDDLKSALRAAAGEVMHETPLGEVLITEIARQDN